MVATSTLLKMDKASLLLLFRVEVKMLFSFRLMLSCVIGAGVCSLGTRGCIMNTQGPQKQRNSLTGCHFVSHHDDHS